MENTEIIREVVANVNKKVVINLDLMTPKQKAMFHWNNLIKWFTHTFYFILYNTIAAMGWVGIVNANGFDGTLHQVAHYSGITFYAAGHVTLNVIHGTISWFMKRPRYDKKVQSGGNPIIKKSTPRIIFLVVALIPPIIWLIGWIIITIHFKNDKSIIKVKKMVDRREQ